MARAAVVGRRQKEVLLASLAGSGEVSRWARKSTALARAGQSAAPLLTIMVFRLASTGEGIMAARNACSALTGSSITRRGAVELGLLMTFGLVGCSGEPSSSVPEPEPEPKPEPEPEPEPIDEEPAPVEEVEPEEPDPADWTEVELEPAPRLEYSAGNVLEPADWHWCDGVLATGVGVFEDEKSPDNGKCTFAAWNPVSGLRFEYSGALQESNEELIGDTPKVIATYGELPVAWVIYRVRRSASGLDPESTHLYARRINFDSGELEERVELLDGEFNDMFDSLIQWVPSSDNCCGIVVATDYNEAIDSGGFSNYHVLALNREGKVSDYYDKEWRYTHSTSASGVFTVDDRYGDRQWLYDLDTGSALFERTIGPTEGYTTDIMPLGADRYLSNVYDCDRTAIIDPAAGMTPFFDKIMSLSPDGYADDPLFASGLHDGSVILGVYGGIAKVDPEGNMSAILDGERGQALGLEVMGVDHMTGDIYVKTTDENVVVSAAGEDVGRWTMYPYSAQPLEISYKVVRFDARKVDAVLYASEETLPDGSGSVRYVVTRGGAPGFA